MTNDGLSQESLNYWRTGILLLNVVTPVLRKFFVRRHEKNSDNGGNLNQFLRIEENKQKLERLNSRVLPRDSLDKVYPPYNGDSDIETWDITLLCLVLKQLFTLTHHELSLVDTIRICRNKIFAHNPNGTLGDREFVRAWSDIVTTVEDMLVIINDPEYTRSVKESIQQYKEKPLQQSEINDAKNVLMEKKWKEEVQEHLISQYENYSTILPVAPLYDDEGIEISELYTDVTLYEDERARGQHAFISEENQIKSYAQLFKRKNTRETVKQILLKGPAGRGKSSYCTRMANVWASAIRKKAEDQGVPLTDDEKEMIQFDFVFLIQLRFSAGVDSAFEMVKTQLFVEAPTYIERLEKCFVRGKCLLVLDGLDEWQSSSGIALPLMDKMYSCSRVISTRPWKLQSIPAHMNFRVVEIGIMDEYAIRTLATKIIANYYNVSIINQEREVNHFMHALRRHSLDSMAEIPLILTYLICVWKDENGLEESKTVNYGGLLECLTKYSKRQFQPKTRKRLPGPLSFRRNCEKYSDILYKLSRLAYNSTISRDQPILVFGKQEVRDYFTDDEELKFCLDSGLLSQSKARGSRANDNVIIQFFHKSVQEFLCALHLATANSGVIKRLQDHLSTVDKVMSISIILIFLCGLRPDLCNDITKNVAETADSSKEFHQYRNSLDGRYSFRKSHELSSYRSVKDIQGLVLSCLNECSYNKRFPGSVRSNIRSFHGVVFITGSWRVRPTLFDFVIKENTKDDTISLLEGNALEIKSLYVDSPSRTLFQRFNNQILKARNLHRLHLDQISSGLIYDIKPNTLNHLQSLSLVLDNIGDFPRNMERLTNLRALSLCISAKYEVIEEFAQYLKRCSRLEEIDLGRIKITTKDVRQQCGISLDLSENRHLKRISVHDISMDEVILHPEVDLEEVWLSGRMSNPSSVLKFLPSSKSLNTVVLGDLFAFNCFRWFANDVLLITQVLPKLDNLKHLHLLGITFVENVLLLPKNAKHLETVTVEDVVLLDENWTSFLRSLVEATDRPVSVMISASKDSYPIQLFCQAPQMHFVNVNIGYSGNRGILKFETNPREDVELYSSSANLNGSKGTFHQDVEKT